MSKVFILGATRPRPAAGFQCHEMSTCLTWDSHPKTLPLVRKKAGFTHNMTIFPHDVRRKRFIVHERVAQRYFLTPLISDGTCSRKMRRYRKQKSPYFR